MLRRQTAQPEFRDRKIWKDRRFWAIAGLSLAVHLLATPLAGWIGLAAVLFEQVEQEVEDEEEEGFDELPVELFEMPEPGLPELPVEDPVAILEELAQQSPPSPPVAAPTVVRPPSPKVTKPAPAPVKPVVAPAASTKPPAPARSATATPVSSAAPAPSASGSVSRAQPPRLHNPIALRGKAAGLVQPSAYVGLVIHLDKIRAHPSGDRIARLLPQLPQWRDFFPSEALDPVRELDRIHLVGPSLTRSANVVATVEYNTQRRRVVKAVDALVKRRGRWERRGSVAVARAVADRAERVFILHPKRVLVITPPQLAEPLMKIESPGVPPPEAGEAVVARIRKPARPLARLGLRVSKSLEWITLRLTPVSGGGAVVELEGLDSGEDQARRSASKLAGQLNAGIDLLSGLSSLLGQFGFMGGIELPRVKIRSHGKRIYGKQVLTQAQVDFLLTRAERHLIGIARRVARQQQAAVRRGKGASPGSAPTAKSTSSRVPKAPR